MNNEHQYDLIGAELSASEAISRVQTPKSAQEYRDGALRVGREILRAHGSVSSMDIVRRLPVPDDVEPRVLGAVMRTLAKEEGLKVSHYISSGSRKNHHRPVAVWA